MNTIEPTYCSTAASPYAVVNRSASNTSFADQVGHAATQSSKTPSDKLTSLLADFEELKRRQVEISPRDYLAATLPLQEQISTERLNTGENLDVFGVRFEGRVYKLAGKLHDPGSLEFVKSETVDLPSLVTPRQSGVDIKI